MTERNPSPLTPGTPGAVPPTAATPVEKAPGEPLGRPPVAVPPAAAAPAPVPTAAPAPAPARGPAAPAPVPAVSEAAARGYESGVTRPPASGNAPRHAADAVPPSRGETRDPGAITTDRPAPPAPPAAPPTAPPAAPPAPAAPAAPVPPPTAAAPKAAPLRVAGHGVRPAEPLDGADLGRLLDGAHHDPHGLLGAHPVDGGVLFRVLRPYALGVAVSASGLRAELLDEGDGIFAGVLPLREIPEYELLVRYADGEHTVQDPYRFLPSLGDLDLHLIGEGRHEQLWHALGARPMTHQGVTGTRFAVWAPNARGVRVAGGFNFWDGTGFPMRSLGSTGVWELFVPGVGEGTPYKFDIALRNGGHALKADPMARSAEQPPATASVVTSSHHTWDDAEWMARRAAVPVHEAPFSVYEVHLTSWRPGLTYRELAEQLPAYVADLGFTHVELMPVAEHPFGGSWGYQVTSYYAPTSRLGSPDDFKFLVDALHRAGIGVIMDWVPAHFPKDDWALANFDGVQLYEHGDPNRAEHPDWGTLEFDLGRTEVRNFMVANAVYWCEEFHIDGLRVDAVASMLYLDYSREHGEWTPNEHGGRENLDAVAFLQEMNATVYRRCPGVVTIAEESTAWDGVTRSTDSGGLGFGLKWNMGWMHDSLEYVAKEPVHRKYHHHDMTFSMVYAYSENYVLPISHDEVVHGKRSLVAKMPGDWWQQRATHRAYLGFMWAHPGKQLLFMGQEFAQGAEWSHDHGPDWWLLDETYPAAADHRGVRDLVRELNRTYNATPALWQRDTDPGGFCWIDGGAAEDNTFSFLRYDADGEPLVCVSNFSPVVRENYRIGVPDRAWQEVLNTDDVRFGGSGTPVGATGQPVIKPEATSWHGQERSVLLTLPPLATVWLRPA